MKTETPPCRLEALSNWSPQFHLFGLEFADNHVSLRHKYFSCCDGSGVQITSSEQKTARVCPLSSRWAAVSTYFKQIYSFCPDAQKKYFTDTNSDADSSNTKGINRLYLSMIELIFREELESFLHSKKGKVFDEFTVQKKLKIKLGAQTPDHHIEHIFPNLFWQIGACLIWHYDTLVLPYTGIYPKKSATTVSSAALLPIGHWDDLMMRHPNKRSLLLIQGVQELWNSTNLERLEGVIAFASERKVPIWLVDSSKQSAGASESPSTEQRSFRANMNQKIERLRQKSALEWLSQQSLSRLSELTLLPEVKSKPPIIPTIV
jgi:hypothetical protein